jgi:putative transposase
VKYAFIQRHRRKRPTSGHCRVLEVSVAGFHENFVRRASTSQQRHLSDDALLMHIKAIHAETRGGYGWPRTWKELLGRRIRIGKEVFRSSCNCTAYVQKINADSRSPPTAITSFR